MSRTADTPADPIEDYLDRLFVTLNGSPRQVRHTLAEVEAHLRDAAEEGVAAGMPEPDAEAQAVARMGPVSGVAGPVPALARPSLALARRLALTAGLVGGAGFLAIGGAGLIERLLVSVKGDAFLTAPWPADSYTRADCADWLAGDRSTHSCVAAMLSDHVGDLLLEATAAGLLGLIVLAAYLVLRRRWRDRGTLTALPAGTAEALGTALATVAAVGCFGRAFNTEMAQRGVGAGEAWSLGAAAAVTAVAFALALLRALRGTARA
jgi:MYXO-CTERM domain-containing protein